MPYISHPLIKPKTLQSRIYQEAILGESLNKNLLCVLPTGLGKTPIAVLLAARRLELFPESKILVLAPTKPLTNQNCEMFRKFLNIDPDEFQIITGMVKPKERKKLYKEKKLVFATPQCVTGDAYIFDLENGPIKIEELFKNIKLNPEKYGDKIGYSSDINLKLLGFSEDKIRPVRAIKAWKLANKELIEIETELKNKIKCTPEHPLLTINSNAEIKWVQAIDLTKNKFIGMIKNINIERKKMDIYKRLKNSKLRICDRKLINETLNDIRSNKNTRLSKYTRFKWNTMPMDMFFELYKKSLPNNLLLTDWTAKSPPIKLKRYFTPSMAYILGAFIGDGHIGNRKGHGGCVVFSDLDRPTISKKLETIVCDIFGISPKKDRRKGLVYYSSALATVLNRMGVTKGNKASNARIPNFLFYHEEDYVANFLSGLFNADGNATYNMISFSTSSEDLAHGIKWLLLKLGIVSGICKQKEREHEIRGKLVRQGILYTVIISGRKQLEKFIYLCKPEKSKCKLLFKSLNSVKSPYSRSKDILPIADALKKAYEEHKKNGGKPLKGQWESIFWYRSVNKVSEFLKKLNSRKARNIEKIISLPIRWVRIKSIRKIKNKSWVYDFTVENDHNFIANFLISHNTIQNDLQAGRISLKEFSLLVTDEAHHSIGRYSYPFVARRYLKEAENPRILGLTASPGATKEKINEICQNLGIEAVEIRTEKDRDVIPYVKEKQIEWIYVELPDSFLRIKKLLDSVYQSRIRTLQKLGFIRKKRVSKKELLQLQAKLMSGVKEGYRKALFGISPCIQAIKIEHARGLLETQGISILEKYWKKLRSDNSKANQRIVANKDAQAAMLLTQELKESGSKHPKIGKLCSIINQQLLKKRDSKIIVFANYRDTVKEIVGVLEKIPGARPVMLIGQKEGISQKEQIENIKEYEKGTYNCLVTTSIGEEGLSLESADIAIFYEVVPSEIRNIQRRGRVARVKIGKIFVLVTKGTRDEAYRWSAYHKEKTMKRTLYGMKGDRKEPRKTQFTLDKF